MSYNLPCGQHEKPYNTSVLPVYIVSYKERYICSAFPVIPSPFPPHCHHSQHCSSHITHHIHPHTNQYPYSPTPYPLPHACHDLTISHANTHVYFPHAPQRQHAASDPQRQHAARGSTCREGGVREKAGFSGGRHPHHSCLHDRGDRHITLCVPKCVGCVLGVHGCI